MLVVCAGFLGRSLGLSVDKCAEVDGGADSLLDMSVRMMLMCAVMCCQAVAGHVHKLICYHGSVEPSHVWCPAMFGACEALCVGWREHEVWAVGYRIGTR